MTVPKNVIYYIRHYASILICMLSLFCAYSSAHPWCVPDGTPTLPSPPLRYCSAYNEWPGACCTANNELTHTKNVVDRIISPDANPECYHHIKEIYCAFCSPLAAHKFNVETGVAVGLGNYPFLCPGFCRRMYSACADVELNTDGPSSIPGAIMRIPGLSAGQGMRKIRELYPDADTYCEAFAINNAGACHTDDPEELNEDSNQLPGVPYQVEYAFPYLDLDSIPKSDPREKAHIVDMIPYGDGSDRLVVTFQTGVVILFDNDPNVNTFKVILDHRSKTAYEDPTEIGFLGVAFDPNFKTNGYMYAKYTPQPNLDYISRFTKKPDSDEFDPNSEVVLLAIPKEDTMHHGGSPIFGPDGMLYIGIGDGVHFAKCYREENPAPLLTDLQGKILRIDVSGPGPDGRPYKIPPDNPFAGNTNGWREEIWAYGIRNPWKMTFDPPTRQLWMTDVGYALWEEINIVMPGKNYGWHRREANHCFYPQGDDCPPEWGEVAPIYEYPHSVEQCSKVPCMYGRCVAGGYVYRGTRVPSLTGVYLFSDYGVGTLWMLNADPVNPYRNTVTRLEPLFPPDFPTNEFFSASFGIDMHNEVYLLNWQRPDIFRFARELRPPPIPPPEYLVNSTPIFEWPPPQAPVAPPPPPAAPTPISIPTGEPTVNEPPYYNTTPPSFGTPAIKPSAASSRLSSRLLLLVALIIELLTTCILLNSNL